MCEESLTKQVDTKEKLSVCIDCVITTLDTSVRVAYNSLQIFS